MVGVSSRAEVGRRPMLGVELEEMLLAGKVDVRLEAIGGEVAARHGPDLLRRGLALFDDFSFDADVPDGRRDPVDAQRAPAGAGQRGQEAGL